MDAYRLELWWQPEAFLVELQSQSHDWSRARVTRRVALELGLVKSLVSVHHVDPQTLVASQGVGRAHASPRTTQIQAQEIGRAREQQQTRVEARFFGQSQRFAISHVDELKELAS